MHLEHSRTLPFVLTGLLAASASGQTQTWIRQLGTPDIDAALASAGDESGGLFVCGDTRSTLGGPSAGFTDAWVARYDSFGNQSWIRQLGSSAYDSARAAVIDGSGGVFISGGSWGSFGGPSAGVTDVWLARFDGAGNLLWNRQLGTQTYDDLDSLTQDRSGGVFVCGHTEGSLCGPSAGLTDFWLAHFDGAGDQLWIRQFGTSSEDYANSAAPDGSGGIYLTGITMGALGGPHLGGLWDAWLARFDSHGQQLWIRQFGTSSNELAQVATPNGFGGVYVAGYCAGDLGAPNAGGLDAWLAQFDSAGNQLWIRQFGTSADEGARSAAPDRSGGVYIGGESAGDMGGTNAGMRDAWLAHYDSVGHRTWIEQIGTARAELAHSATADGTGGVYFCGETYGSLAGVNPDPTGNTPDAWIAHYDGLCPAARSYCTAKVNSLGCPPTIGWSGTPTATGPIDDFHVIASNVLNRKPGLMIWSTQPGSSPLGGGTLCLSPPVIRTTTQQSGGTPAPAIDCTGQYSFHFGHAYLQSHFLAAGQTIRAQYWSRDPGFPAPNGIGLTNALTFMICP